MPVIKQMKKLDHNLYSRITMERNNSLQNMENVWYVCGIGMMNGAQASTKGVSLDAKLMDKEAQKGFVLTPVDRLLYRTRYFTDSGLIGTKAFVARCSKLFTHHFSSRHAKRQRPVTGLPGVYALKRLSTAS